MKLTDFVLNTSWEELPETARHAARRCVLDTLGCAIAGSGCEQLLSRIETCRQQGQSGTSPIWGTNLSLNPGWAIFFNVHTAAYYDLDDGHRRAQGHPGAAIIPVALATALQRNLSGRDFLTAVVIGYEVAIRSALMIRKLGGPRKGSGGWVTIGAAAAAARLLGCTPAKTLHAIGLAEYYSPQAPQDRSVAFPSEMKEGIPWGAYAGYTAALLASGGFSGMRPQLVDDPFSGDLGAVYEIEKTYFKNYASCRWAHPALDGLKQLQAERLLSIATIREIRVHSFEKGVLMQRTDPATVMEALYSIPFAIACFLLHGQLDPQQLRLETLQDPEVSDLAQRVKLLADPELTSRFPEQCLQRLEIDFNNGASYRSPLLSAKGDPDQPYSESELIGKFSRLVAPVLGSQTGQIIALGKELERHPLADLVKLLTPQSLP